MTARHQTKQESVGATILQQLGGHKFIAMTGAKDFVGGANYLMFAVPASMTKNRINKVRITLAENDTYTMEFLKCNYRKHTFDTLANVENVYHDKLQDVFTEETGLDTHL